MPSPYSYDLRTNAIETVEQGYGHKITDWEKFRAFLTEHQDKTQAQIAELWGQTSLSKILAMHYIKLVLRAQKRLTAIEKEMKPNA